MPERRAPRQAGQTLRRLQTRWGLSLWQVIAVLLAFSLAGSTTVLLKGPVTGLLLSPDTPPWQQWAIYLVVMVRSTTCCCSATAPSWASTASFDPGCATSPGA